MYSSSFSPYFFLPPLAGGLPRDVGAYGLPGVGGWRSALVTAGTPCVALSPPPEAGGIAAGDSAGGSAAAASAGGDAAASTGTLFDAFQWVDQRVSAVPVVVALAARAVRDAAILARNVESTLAAILAEGASGSGNTGSPQPAAPHARLTMAWGEPYVRLAMGSGRRLLDAVGGLPVHDAAIAAAAAAGVPLPAAHAAAQVQQAALSAALSGGLVQPSPAHTMTSLLYARETSASATGTGGAASGPGGPDNSATTLSLAAEVLSPSLGAVGLAPPFTASDAYRVLAFRELQRSVRATREAVELAHVTAGDGGGAGDGGDDATTAAGVDGDVDSSSLGLQLNADGQLVTPSGELYNPAADGEEAGAASADGRASPPAAPSTPDAGALPTSAAAAAAPDADPLAHMCQPVFSLLLSSVASSRMRALTDAVFATATAPRPRGYGLSPAAEAYGCLLAAYAAPPHCDSRRAQGVLREMRARGLTPNSRVYSELALLLAREGGSWGLAAAAAAGGRGGAQSLAAAASAAADAGSPPKLADVERGRRKAVEVLSRSVSSSSPATAQAFGWVARILAQDHLDARTAAAAAQHQQHSQQHVAYPSHDPRDVLTLMRRAGHVVPEQLAVQVERAVGAPWPRDSGAAASAGGGGKAAAAGNGDGSDDEVAAPAAAVTTSASGGGRPARRDGGSSGGGTRPAWGDRRYSGGGAGANAEARRAELR